MLSLLYYTLLITSIAMLMLLVLVFLDDLAKPVLKPALYRKLFILLSVICVTGIVMASSIGFSLPAETKNQSALITPNR